MLTLVRTLLVGYGLIAIATGILGASATYDAVTTTPMQDNNHRYVAAIWASMGLAFLFVAWNPSEVSLFRFLMAALFIGGLVRAIALVNYPPTPFIVFIIAIELIPPPLMLWLHSSSINAARHQL
ncbi:MAG: DUF4345 domain-containing protein [Lysobacterales bacterium]|nr:DUF4345 domain-containing protein [Xanthomonadales bacterium]MCB1613504.1 DUF4345 domain-containing protein [Xanthomonadales bacterium]